ncbi:hypothetical protein ABZ896_35885, partial [Streptomyces sp. NPDC047072]
MPLPRRSTVGSRARAQVIDRAWRSLGPGLEPLSGPGGAPLTRSVKLIVLPLIVRPALRPELATDFLGPEQAARLDALIRESGPLLTATARWFTLLKKARRALGVVAGNPQDLYFQRCFELATEHGAPSAGAESLARAVVEEVADAGGGRTVDALRTHLADEGLRARLDAELAGRWERRGRVGGGGAAGVLGAAVIGPATVGPATVGPATVGSAALGSAALGAEGFAAAVLASATEALDACGAPGDSPAYAAMIEAGHGELFGRALWGPPDEGERWGRGNREPADGGGGRSGEQPGSESAGRGGEEPGSESAGRDGEEPPGGSAGRDGEEPPGGSAGRDGEEPPGGSRSRRGEQPPGGSRSRRGEQPPGGSRSR